MDDRRRSKPWRDEEYIWIDGLPCVYIVRSNDVLVIQPGHPPISVRAVRYRWELRLPATWRKEEERRYPCRGKK